MSPLSPSGAPGGLPPQDQSCRRRFGRVRVGNVRCTLGRVVDVSAGGMRVLNRSMTQVKPGTSIPIQVETDDGWIKSTARVAWVRPAGVFRQELGLEFIELDAEARAAIIALARQAASSRFSLLQEPEPQD